MTYRPEDFAGSHDVVDWSDAFDLMLRKIDNDLGLDGNNIRKGATIQLSARDYFLGRSLIEERPNRWVGEGTNLALVGSTRIFFGDGAGLIVPGWRQRTTAIGHGSSYENITFIGGEGLYFAGIFSVKDCSIYDSNSNGITIDGHTGNANSWVIRDTFIVSSNGYGIAISGPDSNAGIADHVATTQNALGGFYDNAFLLTTYVACSTHESSGPSWTILNKSSRAVLIGCYEERGGPSGQFNGLADIYGGNIQTDDKTSRYAASRYHGLHAFDYASFGEIPDQAITFKLNKNEWGMGFDPVTNSMRIGQSRLKPSPLRFTGTKSTGYGERGRKLRPNHIWLSDIYFGPPNDPKKIYYSSKNPPPVSNDAMDGDRCQILNPEIGEPFEYVFVNSEWRPLGRVE